MVNPVKVIGDASPEARNWPELQLTLYLVMGVPLLAGVVKEMVTCPLPVTAPVMMGAPGGVSRVTFIGVDRGPVPTTLVAATVQE